MTPARQRAGQLALAVITVGLGAVADLVQRRPVGLVSQGHGDGSPKILPECTPPLTGIRMVDRIFSDLDVFDGYPR